MFALWKHAPRMTSIRARFEEGALRAKARKLAESPPARQGLARRDDRWAAIHRLVGLKTLRIKLGLALDRIRALAGGKQRLASLEAKRHTLAVTAETHVKEAKEADSRMEAFAKQFEDSPNLLTGIKRWTPAWAAALVVGLLSLDFGLNLPGFELVIDSATGTLFGVQLPLDLIAATAFTLAQGVGVKFAGKHAAWGWSPLVVCADRRDARSEDANGRKHVVPSEWSRKTHRIIAVTAGALVVASVIAVVAIRLPALNLLNANAGSGTSGGLIGGGTGAPEGGVSGAALSALSLLPLLVAALVSGWLEGPMRSSLRGLRKDCNKSAKTKAKLAKAINKLDAKRVKVGIGLNAVDQQKTVERRLADVGGATESEVIADEAPAVFGVFSTERPSTVRPDDELREEVEAIAPEETEPATVGYPETLADLWRDDPSVEALLVDYAKRGQNGSDSASGRRDTQEQPR